MTYRKKPQPFVAIHGREILDAAIEKKTELHILDYTKEFFDLKTELLERGFYIASETSFSPSEFNEGLLRHIELTCLESRLSFLTSGERIDFQRKQIRILKNIQKLAKATNSSLPNFDIPRFSFPNPTANTTDQAILSLVKFCSRVAKIRIPFNHEFFAQLEDELRLLGSISSPYLFDNKPIPTYRISWAYPSVPKKKATDCLCPRILDWISDIHGQKIFQPMLQILKNLDYGDNVEIEICKTVASSAYTYDTKRITLGLFNKPVPFKLSRIKSAIEILGYDVKILRRQIDDRKTSAFRIERRL